MIAKGIIRRYSMRQRQAAVKPPILIISNCDVCGVLMFNAQRYMHMNDAYFSPSMIWFPYERKKMFDRILPKLQYLDREHPHHLHWVWISWKGYSITALFKVDATPFPLPV